MDKNRKKGTVTAAVLLILSIIAFASMMTVLAPCGPKEDGSFMNCHYAGLALRILSGLAVCTGLVSFVTGKSSGQGSGRLHTAADVLTAVLSIAMIIVPGNVIHLCMMPEMRCRAVMKPGSMVLSVLLLCAAAADLFLTGKKQD